MLKLLNNLWGQRTMVVVEPARHAAQPGGTGSLESIPELLKSLKIRAMFYEFISDFTQHLVLQ